MKLPALLLTLILSSPASATTMYWMVCQCNEESDTDVYTLVGTISASLRDDYGGGGFQTGDAFVVDGTGGLAMWFWHPQEISNLRLDDDETPFVCGTSEDDHEACIWLAPGQVPQEHWIDGTP